MFLRFPTSWVTAILGLRNFAETKIMVSVVDCVAAQVMSLGFNADFMWLNKLKTSENARVFHTLMAYLLGLVLMRCKNLIGVLMRCKNLIIFVEVKSHYGCHFFHHKMHFLMEKQ
jgi:hypothetical protein